MPPTALIYKKLGETPLEALERFRAEKIAEAYPTQDWKTIPMTYAGRLDPMAEGLLLILIGDECKNKEEYLGLDKEYEVEILFGVSTDTHDVLGLVDFPKGRPSEVNIPKVYPSGYFSKYIGKFSQPYPSYSSKTVNGKQLHQLARSDELPDEMPEKEVEIYSIAEVYPPTIITAVELKVRILSSIDLVKGDFRQSEVKSSWKQTLNGSTKIFSIITIRVKCSSGTYMRSLAHKIGKDMGTCALALSIKRTKIGDYIV